MTRTDEFFDLTVNLEGGFSDRAEDRGGRTKYGITQQILDYYNVKHSIPKEDVATITTDKAKDIYIEFYYLPVIPVVDKEIHFNFVDMAYNSGNARYMELRDSVGDSPTIEAVYEWRINFFEKLDESANIGGWLNRLNRIKDYFNKENS